MKKIGFSPSARLKDIASANAKLNCVIPSWTRQDAIVGILTSGIPLGLDTVVVVLPGAHLHTIAAWCARHLIADRLQVLQLVVLFVRRHFSPVSGTLHCLRYDATGDGGDD